jgi:hypothetical protein
MTDAAYADAPSRPCRTATIDQIMCGKHMCSSDKRDSCVDLGLYSMTFNNSVETDAATLEAYLEFRLEAEQKRLRHILEVFDPNCPQNPVADVGRFVADSIARALAGTVGAGRPLFLKIVYHGPAALERLTNYDSSLVIGVLGGASGTTYDAFHQLWESKRYGARAAIYGRMIHNSEDQLSFIQHLRWLADGEIDDPAEAVRSYHSVITGRGLTPWRTLDNDLQSTRRCASYGGV